MPRPWPNRRQVTDFTHVAAGGLTLNVVFVVEMLNASPALIRIHKSRLGSVQLDHRSLSPPGGCPADTLNYRGWLGGAHPRQNRG